MIHFSGKQAVKKTFRILILCTMDGVVRQVASVCCGLGWMHITESTNYEVKGTISQRMSSIKQFIG